MNRKEQEREWNQEDMAKYEKWLQEEVELREVTEMTEVSMSKGRWLGYIAGGAQ